MAQRCSYCGRTKKQHNGIACIDREGLCRALKAGPYGAYVPPNGMTVLPPVPAPPLREGQKRLRIISDVDIA